MQYGTTSTTYADIIAVNKLQIPRDCDPTLFLDRLFVRLANSKARIKPTAPLSAFDKENSMEFLLYFLHYLYNYYMVCALLSHAYHVTYHMTSCHVTVTTCDVTLSCTPFCVVSSRKRKEKEKKYK